MLRILIGTLAVFSLWFGPAQSVSAQGERSASDAILILDASGSMWGQIEGINKIVIARDVVEGLVRSMPEEQRLGMVAYGHRKKGDCSDIETLADVGADRESVIGKIRALSPKGKTPLSKSVEHAAKELNYQKQAATVILVSDGLENCDADPCALARTLEENGLDFTVHVVGFDVTEHEHKGLACIAQETGGQFFAADNADELTDALARVAMVEPQRPDSTKAALPVALKATILQNGPDIQSKLSWNVTRKPGGEPVFSEANTGYADTELAPGDYVARAVWSGWREGGEKTGEKAFTVTGVRATIVTVPIDLGIPVTLESDPQIAEGHPVNIRWSGPDDLGASITVNRLDDGPRDKIYFLPAQRARDSHEKSTEDTAALDTNGDGQFNQDDMASAQVGGPSIEGNYEVRYVLSDPLLILARNPLTVTDGQYSVSAPAEVPAAESFSVTWDGLLTDGDFVTIIEKDSASVFSNGRTARLVSGKPAQLVAFAEPGDYEVRYILANGYTTYPGMQHAVQASTPIRIVAVAATIMAPDTVVGGSTIDVAIEAPGDSWSDDVLSVVEAGAIKTNSAARQSLGRILNEDGTFRIRMPAVAGNYEFAYFLYPGGTVIERRPVTITQADATVEAPNSVPAGENFEIRYSGDAFGGDRIIVCPADTPDAKMWQWSANYGFAAKDGETVGTVNGARASAKPGQYEARYVTGLQHVVLARDVFTVTEP